MDRDDRREAKSAHADERSIDAEVRAALRADLPWLAPASVRDDDPAGPGEARLAREEGDAERVVHAAMPWLAAQPGSDHLSPLPDADSPGDRVPPAADCGTTVRRPPPRVPSVLGAKGEVPNGVAPKARPDLLADLSVLEDELAKLGEDLPLLNRWLGWRR